MPVSKPRKKRPKFLKTALICLTVLCVGAGGYSAYLVYQANHALNQMSAGPADLSETPPISTIPISGKASTGNEWRPMTFLLTGVDHREGSGGSMNSDVLMLVALNPQTSSATIVSVPRDMELKPKEFGLSSHKINYYYAYYYNQDKNTAIPKTKALFSRMFDIPIDYMAVIDFDGFREVVDALKGVKVDVDMDMRYVDDEDGTNINLKKGLQTLSGKQTLDFLRYRKSNRGTEESSDIARNQRQQEVLNQLLDKMTSFSGITQWGDLLEIAGRNVKTDIPADQLRNFILSFPKLKPSTIDFIHLNGEWASPYIIPKESDMRAAINALRAQTEQEDDTFPSSGGTSVTEATYDRLMERFRLEPDKKVPIPSSTVRTIGRSPF
ncbi:LCP family protein [Paenibacillus allorhizosphaerae]|uniref:Polyisoprenyl-teichoic acid--peptidoglycan teichoic acid transferase TagU n=1 Tax=Paenibacillus allorhizosphaerae TaxID=2849866 RepID=A0ABN7TVF7_9BACL|nr:LCP family protein [Paenibacillus allorhizosphaerae]CAG7657351.1 Polyisoprenyl-teichoic acid--peptidoglycan teichoic acid transferase TagU [Paenibacillus allorhizosphaerae]